MYKEVHFVRHAESVMNARRPWLDTVTNPLTDKGHREAEAVSKVLTGTPDLIVTSPYIRTLETAKPFLKRHPEVKHEEWQVQEYNQVCHINRGLLTFDERRALIHKAWEREDPDYCDGPSAESFRAMMTRVDKAIAQIFETDFRFSVIFTHGFFLSALFYRIENRDEEPIPMLNVRNYKLDQSIPNTAIIRCRFFKDGAIEVSEIDTDHLGPDQHVKSIHAN